MSMLDDEIADRMTRFLIRYLVPPVQSVGITEVASPNDFSVLELCYHGLCKLPPPDAKRRRIDILCFVGDQRSTPSLLYGK
jgi:hypothetical protein